MLRVSSYSSFYMSITSPLSVPFTCKFVARLYVTSFSRTFIFTPVRVLYDNTIALIDFGGI